MASERVPACASYLAETAAPHLADAISVAMKNYDSPIPLSLIDTAFESARASLSPGRIRAIMGTVGDDWAQEAYASAVKLSNEALVAAFGAGTLWDRRRTFKTRRTLLRNLVQTHIRQWADVRGMDPNMLAELRDQGGEE